MSIELLEIEVPSEFMGVCRRWAGGTDCMLCAIDSTGSLTRGTNRPWNHDFDRPMNDYEWHRSLYSSLSSDISYNRKLAEKSNDTDDAWALNNFEQWVDSIVEKMDATYPQCCIYCGGNCPNDVDYACDGFHVDEENYYNDED